MRAYKDYRWQAFGISWFHKRQRGLLLLLNLPVIRLWFRWVLRIHRDLKPSERIIEIQPHCYKVWIGPHTIQTDFRTHPKFSKRIYFGFKYLWLTLHFWDWLIADRFVPELSFGYSIVGGPYYPEPYPGTYTVDGYLQNSYSLPAGVTWGTIRLGNGTLAAFFGQQYGFATYMASSNTTNQWGVLERAIFLFRTNDIPTGATISSAIMSLCSFGKKDDLGVTPDVNIYASNPATNTKLVGADFKTLGTIPFATAIPYASWPSNGTYANFNLNASGLGAISKGGITKFGAQNGNYDAANNPPAWSLGKVSNVGCYFAGYTGTSRDPKLVVTYDVSSVLNLEGLAITSVANIEGVVPSNIVKVE